MAGIDFTKELAAIALKALKADIAEQQGFCFSLQFRLEAHEADEAEGFVITPGATEAVRKQLEGATRHLNRLKVRETEIEEAQKKAEEERDAAITGVLNRRPKRA